VHKQSHDRSANRACFPAAYNGNIVSGSAHHQRDPARGIRAKEAPTCSSPAWLGAARRVRRDVSGDGKTASVPVAFSTPQGLAREGPYAGGTRCHAPMHSMGTFQDIANIQWRHDLRRIADQWRGHGLSIQMDTVHANVAFQRQPANTVAEVAWVGNWVYSWPERGSDRLPLYVFGNVDSLFLARRRR
jgi:hypothetical protein